MGTSHQRAFDTEGVVQIFRDCQPTGRWREYHSNYHQCCLVLPQPLRSTGVRSEILKEESKTFMENICQNVWDQSPHTQIPCPNIVTISFPGLNTYKIKSNKLIPGGDFKGYSIKQSLQHFKNATMSSLIFGSNDWKKLFKNNAEEAVSKFFDIIQDIYNNTNFNIVFISTIFPRKEMLVADENVYRCNVQEFNDCLINKIGIKELRIKNLDGKLVVLKWRIINMSEVLAYEKMISPKMYCNICRNQIHIQGIYSQKFLELLIQAIKCYKTSKSRPRVKGWKRKAEVS